MKGYVDLGSTQWFSTLDPWIGDPTTLVLGMNKNKNQISILATRINEN